MLRGPDAGLRFAVITITIVSMGFSAKQIAEKVGCIPKYVYVVTRQRVRGASVHDRQYNQRVYSAGDRERARRAGKKASTNALFQGECRQSAYQKAYHAEMRKTGRAALRKEAAHA